MMVEHLSDDDPHHQNLETIREDMDARWIYACRSQSLSIAELMQATPSTPEPASLTRALGILPGGPQR